MKRMARGSANAAAERWEETCFPNWKDEKDGVSPLSVNGPEPDRISQDGQSSRCCLAHVASLSAVQCSLRMWMKSSGPAKSRGALGSLTSGSLQRKSCKPPPRSGVSSIRMFAHLEKEHRLPSRHVGELAEQPSKPFQLFVLNRSGRCVIGAFGLCPAHCTLHSAHLTWNSLTFCLNSAVMLLQRRVAGLESFQGSGWTSFGFVLQRGAVHLWNFYPNNSEMRSKWHW